MNYVFLKECIAGIRSYWSSYQDPRFDVPRNLNRSVKLVVTHFLLKFRSLKIHSKLRYRYRYDRGNGSRVFSLVGHVTQ